MIIKVYETDSKTNEENQFLTFEFDGTEFNKLVADAIMQQLDLSLQTYMQRTYVIKSSEQQFIYKGVK